MKSYRRGRSYCPKGYFGQWLASKLIERKITIKKMSEDLGFRYGIAERYVSDGVIPSHKRIRMLCEYFEETDIEKVYQLVRLDDAAHSHRFVQEKYTAFGKWLIDVMIENELNQSELAPLLNIDNTTISHHIRNVRRPSRKTLKRYADYFGVSSDVLWDMLG